MNFARRTLPAALILTLGATTLACGSAPARIGSASATPPAYGGGDDGPGDAEGSGASGFGQQAPATAPRSEAALGADSTTAPGAPIARESEEPTPRPGLGTEWGETRFSRISTVPFVRAEPSSPFATASLFYNDEEGAEAMASRSGFRRTSGAFSAGGGAVTVGLRDEHGGMLPSFMSGDRNFVVGEAGRRYSIVVQNRTSNRLEIVLSVDGLDVLDGREASFAKRGYLVDAGDDLEVDGFRQSTDTVAAFRFGSVSGSYAGQKHGDTRNVGVIGVAAFHERGTNPFPWSQDEVARRREADPFPGRFATPPR